MSTSERYGRRLIPQIVDELAAAEPDRILYSIATSADISQPLQQVSARAFTTAVDNTAWWLQESVGKSSKIQAIGYIGPHDLRHIILTYACVKANCTALFLSPKNSTEGALAVLKTTDCKIWVKPKEQSTLPLVQDVLQQHDMQVLELPQLDELLDAELAKPYPYEKTFEEAMQEPFCLMHSSGSTGLPKPIAWSHGLIGTMDAVRLLPPTDGDDGMEPWTKDWKDGDTLYSTFPMSHGAGIIMDVLMPALFRLHCLLGPAHVIPNINLIESLAEHGNIDIWSMIPSIVDELGETPDVLAKFTSSKFICASGGPVSPISASKVNDVIRVLNLTGTTEGLFIGNLVTDREDWLYFAFHPFSGFEFKEVEPGVYEHWIHRNEHWDLFQGYFHTFPDLQTVNVKDLYVQHPKKPNLWAYKGRNDDVIVLSNGYKISPLDTEALITTHPAIDGCLMIGSGKSQAGLLIELKDPEAPRTNDLFDSIWAIVERANSMSLHKNQLHKDFIAFTEPDKPFIRTDKRTVKRRATIELYTEYIERFYDTRQEDLDADLAVSIDTSSIDSITDGICKTLTFLSPSFEGIQPSDDVFYLGLDSLLVVRVIKLVRAATGLQSQLAPKHLYKYPTIDQFATAVAQIAKQTQGSDGNNASSHDGGNSNGDEYTSLSKILRKHDARLMQKMNPFDLINSNMYIGMLYYFPLRDGIDFQEAYSVLQKGLKRTIEMIPALEGMFMDCSEQEPEYKKGTRCIVCPPFRSINSTNDDSADSSTHPKQLTYKDLSSVLPSFEDMQKDGFVPGRYKDAIFCDQAPFPQLPADVFNARANFIEGGCILATNLHHQCADGMGKVVVMQAWAENCRFVMGDKSATCEWLHPDSFNHNLPYAVHEHEGYARPAHEIDPEVWNSMSFNKPREQDSSVEKVDTPTTTEPKAVVPFTPYQSQDGQSLRPCTFLISPSNAEKLRQDVISDSTTASAGTSINLIVSALYWRAAMKARYRLATERHGQTFSSDDIATLELPLDVRSQFSSLLPTSYIGSLYVMNRLQLTVEELCSPTMDIGRIVQVIRNAIKTFTPATVHDTFTLLQTVDDYSINNNRSRDMTKMNAMLDNLILFPTSDIAFPSDIFGNGGTPETMRIRMDHLNERMRIMFVYPMRKDGTFELTLGLLPDERKIMMEDEEFMKYATYLV